MTVGEIKTRLSAALSEYGVENPRFEAEQLLLRAGIPKRSALLEPRGEAPSDCEKLALELLERRLSGYPLQYLVGEWDFCAHTFKVGEGVLIPRQDTETAAELAGEFLKERPPEKRRVLDLCAGSGCIGIVLARDCGAKAVCVESSAEAFAYLTENVGLNGVSDSVTAVCGDIFDGEILRGVGGGYNLIVSNPPYLSDSDMKALQKEVTFEPKSALYGGADGLDFYRKILGIYPQKLAAGGMIAFEIGIHQDAAVGELFEKSGLEPRFRRDLCGVKRVVYAVNE